MPQRGLCNNKVPRMPPLTDVRPLVVRRKHAMALLDNVSKPTLTKLIRSGAIDSFMEGRIRWITTESIERYVKRKLAAASPK